MANTWWTGIIVAALTLAGCGGDSQEDSATRSFPCVAPAETRYVSQKLAESSPGKMTRALFQGGIYRLEPGQELVLNTNITELTLGDADIETNPIVSSACIAVLDTADPGFVYILSDGLPDYDTSDFPNTESPTAVMVHSRVFRIPSTPAPADQITELSATSFDGVLLNGVLVQLREAGCAGSDCGLPYNANPMHAPTLYGMDEHHAHTLSDGTYHYHGDPRDIYSDDGSLSGVVGFAADGYPIYGPWFNDDGIIRKAISSYQLKAGSITTEAGQYFYNGSYVEDYEYVANSGDLDECNGMAINGQYGYYITETFPYILNCLRGSPDNSFGFQNISDE